MDSAFWSLIFNFRVKNKVGLDADFADKINYLLTSAVFIISTLILSIRYFCGKVITCWCPNEFLPIQVEYVENYCWIMSTYHYNMSSYVIPESHVERDEKKLAHYQWIPFMLVVCSFMFHIPIMVYRVLNWRSGIKVLQIMSVAADVDTTQDKNDREGSVKFIARYLREALCVQRTNQKGCFGKCKQRMANTCLWFGPRYGNYLVVLYFFCKLLFLTNALGQFFIMYKFLGSKHSLFYGFEFIRSISSGYEWDEAAAFPREVYCDFTLKRLYNSHRYTVQCLLPINLFAEKIFVFLWFWYCFILLATIYSFVTWLWTMLWRKKRIQFIKRYLEHTNVWNKNSSVPKSAITYFVERELRYDGVFILRFIALNCGELVCAEVVSHMWRLHCRLKQNDRSSRNARPNEELNSLNKKSNGKRRRNDSTESPELNNISEV